MRPLSRIFGVTLLEIMLMLAISALIVIAALRFYSIAQLSQQSTAIFRMVLSLSNAADKMAIGTGDYSLVTASALKTAVGPQNFNSPLIRDLDVKFGSPGKEAVSVMLRGVPQAVCATVLSKLRIGAPDSRYMAGGCTSTGEPKGKEVLGFVYVYPNT